jgi:allantoicase
MANEQQTDNDGMIFDEVHGEYVSSAENEFASLWHNLADPRLGATVISVSDDWFAAKERLIDPQAPCFIPGKFDDNGKWMDGWESRRRRDAGHDHCVVKLATQGRIRGVNIDTSHFTGNYPPSASLEACNSAGELDETTEWFEILTSVKLQGNEHHLHSIESEGLWTHVRLNIYPDGGIARLRVYGDFHLDWDALGEQAIDLAAIAHGAWLVDCSDQHYGSPANILYPGIGANMGEGWETSRRREPGNEWAIFRLAHPGIISQIIVDTTHFKGNYPDRCSIQAANLSCHESSAVAASIYWEDLLPQQKLSMDQIHSFEKQVMEHETITHIRFNMIPDGGVNRLRLFGRPTTARVCK